MKLNFALSIFVFILSAIAPTFFISGSAFASDIQPVSFTELVGKSDYVVIATVISVKEISLMPETGVQNATIRIERYLKGRGLRSENSIQLKHKGLVDFDPELKAGDAGVFFLNKNKKGEVELAFFGAVAIFPKNNFVSTAAGKK